MRHSRFIARIIPATVTIAFLSLLQSVSAKEHDYPMKVQVVRSHWHGNHGWRYGFGRANLERQEPGQPRKQAMDFNFSCTIPVRVSMGDDSYPARFNDKNHLEVIVALPVMGSDKVQECTLKTEMHDYSYRRAAGHQLFTVPLSGGQEIQIQDNDSDSASQI